MSNITYHAKSKNDIAEMFEQFAKNVEATKHLKSKGKCEQRLIQMQIYLWNEAARIVRETQLDSEVR